MNLTDHQLFEYSVLEKAKAPGILSTVGGVFQRADTKNANGRIYSKDIWQGLLTNEDINERLKNKQMLGMFGHPASGTTDELNVSHIVTKQELRPDNTVYGEAEILDTPAGRVVNTLFNAGVKLGVSSRGDGTVEKKGGAHHVQNDFKLETYDFVLKPSTPGAYPGLVAEEIEENDALVVRAIEGLVKSDIPADKRKGVLSECLKILSVLESANADEQVQLVSQKLQEELAYGETIMIEADPSAPLPNYQEESNMGTNVKPTSADPQSEEITLKWHQAQVESAVTQLSEKKDEEIRTLKDTVVKAQQESTELRKKIEAAESLIEDFQTEVTSLKEGSMSDEYATLSERYAASVELLDEAIKRLPEIGTLRRRNESLEGLLEASVEGDREKAVASAVEECMAGIPDTAHETVRPVLEGCQTPEEVANTFKALLALAEKNGPAPASKEPLPTTPVPVVEVQAPTHAPRAKTFSSILGSRLQKAV